MADGYISQIKTPDNKTYLLRDSEKTDEKVKQTSNSESKEFPIILKNTNNTTDETAGVKYAGGVTVNPSTGKITATNVLADSRLIASKAISQIITGTGTAGSYTNSTYYPAKWTFNTGLTAMDGDIFTIKIPVAGHDYGVFMSIDNGANYYPVVLNGTGRITTHYPVNTYLTVIFEPTGSAASMYAVAGLTSSTRITVTGGVWRVLNYYDSNSNDTGYYHRRIYPNLKAGGAIHPYSIIMQLPNGKWSGITTTAPNNPGKSNVSPVATGKAANTSGFMLGHVLLMYANTTYADTNNIGTYNIWSAHTGLIDARYSFNLANSTGNGFVAYTPVYIVGTVSNGLFYLDTTKWWTQTLPSNDDGKVYIYIGDAYDWYRLTFTEDKPIYWYKNGAVRLYSGASEYAVTAPLSGISGADDLKAIEAISGTTGLLKKTAANTWTLDTSNYVTSSGITSVTIGATSPVQSSTSTVLNGSSASTTISLKDAYGDTKNPYGAKAKNLVLAGPSSGSNAAPSFRALVAADIPTLAYVPATSGVNDVNTLVNTGIYNITSGLATNAPKGYGYGQLLVMSYRKHTGNTTTDWASLIYLHNGVGTETGNATGPGNVLYYRTSNTSSSNSWFSWQKAVHTAAAYTKVGNADLPVYIAEDGSATAITAVGAAYGGTGKTTLKDSANTLINALDTGSSDLTANDYVITLYVGGGTTTTSYHRRPASKVINATLVKAALGTVNTTAKKFLKDTGAWTQVAFSDLSGTATNALLANSKVIIAGNEVNLGESLSDSTLRESLGLSNALHFIGITSTTLTDGSTTATLTAKSTDSLTKTTGFVDGDVVMDGDLLREYVWSGSAWRLLGITTSTAYTLPASTATNTWIAQISQGTDGKITATTGSLNTSGTWSGNATTATTATNLANNPSILTSGTTQVTITAGGKTSSAYTIPYATSAGSATSAITATYIKCTDTRNATLNPTDLTAALGVRFDFKAKGTINLTATDAYAGVMSFRPYASNTDWSGGNAHLLAFNSEGLHWRNGGASWGNWYLILDSNNTATGTNNTATLTWNTTYTIAKINGTDIKFTTMTKPTYAFSDLTSHPTTLSDYGITNAVLYNGIDNDIGSSATAANAKSYWANNNKVPKGKVVFNYNSSGTEFTTLFSNNNNSYGSILRWGYQDTYIRILRAHPNQTTYSGWYTEDWEKISAGYADSAGTATSAGKWTTARTLTIGSTGKSVDGSGNVSWSLAEIGAAASSHTHPVSLLTWGGGVNLATTATANNLEWSIDLSPGTYTGTYWHVWSTPKNGSILTCHPDDRHVTMPGNIASTSTSTGTLQVTGGIGATGQVTATRLAANGSDTTYNLYVNGPSYSNINAYMPYLLSLDNPKVSRKLTEHNTSSYRHWIVLLLPYQTATNTSINNYIHGHIHFKKTGSNIYDEVFISANLCYNQLKYRLENYGDGGSTAFTPISCTYNGVKYFALKCYDHDNPWTEIYFDGYCISSYPGGNNTSTKPLTLPYMINYKGNGTQAGALTIVNTEVNNSISTTLTDSIVTNVSRYYPYMNINGNASTASKTTAANLTTTANAIAYYTDTTGTLGTKASANGALYATSANGALSWGTLPIALGGTGKTSAADAWAALGGGASGKHDDSYFAKASHNHAASDINSGTFDAARIPNLSWNKITSDKPTTLSGYGITDAKIASGVITLGSNTITPVTSVNGHSGSSVSVTASDLGLASALKYVGTKSSLPTATDSATYSTYNNGDVITVSAKEYAYVKGSNAAGSSWVELGDEGSYKLRQTAFANSTGTADGTNTSTSFIYSFSQNENGAISDIKTRLLPTLTNVSYTATAATDDNEYPVLMKNSIGSDTTAAGVRFASGANQQVTINPSTGTVSTRRLVINNSSSNGSVPDLVFSRTSWSYINIPDNDSAVLAIGRSTGDNADQKLIILGSGIVRPGSDNTQSLGTSARRWQKVYGVNFYGTFNGTATSAQLLAAREIDNSDLNLFISGGALKYAWVGGGNSILSKPTSVNAFGVIVMKTATNWTGQLLMSTDSEPGLYWRTNLTTETPTYGTWARVWDSSNHRVFYGTCAEAAGTATKPVVCTDYDEMKVGDIITVKFNNTNTAASPTLNVNGKGSESIKMAYSGGTADLSSYTQLAGIRTFIYDGTNWILQEGECVKLGVTDTTSDIWRPVMLGAYNSTDVRQAPEQRYAMIHAARNVKYHQTTGTLRAPILKTPKLSIEYSFEDKAHIQWNDTDSSIDFIFD